MQAFQETLWHLPVSFLFNAAVRVYVSFIAKTKLIDHYTKTLGAVHVGAQRMVINTEAALRLIDKYFPK